MKSNEATAVAHLILEYVENMHNLPEPPALPELLAEDELFLRYHANMIALRNTLNAFANGDLSPTVFSRGFIAGSCKALQANLRHLVWKVQQVENGDYTQRVNFLGDFSSAFNSMVVKLATTIEDLQQKEEALTNLAVSLQEEARRRSTTMQELKKSEAKFKYLAQYDPLTNTLNRRSFFPLAEATLQSAAALGNPCCLCLMDIDHFKRFNDSYGHTEGDKALKHVVEQSKESLRQADTMARYGGEEFIFLFPGADLQQGYAAANRARLAIEQSRLTLENGEVVGLTASFGGVEIQPQYMMTDYEKDLQIFIAQADVALYEAKTKGRNQVCMVPAQKHEEGDNTASSCSP